MSIFPNQSAIFAALDAVKDGLLFERWVVAARHAMFQTTMTERAHRLAIDSAASVLWSTHDGIVAPQWLTAFQKGSPGERRDVYTALFLAPNALMRSLGHKAIRPRLDSSERVYLAVSPIVPDADIDRALDGAHPDSWRHEVLRAALGMGTLTRTRRKSETYYTVQRPRPNPWTWALALSREMGATNRSEMSMRDMHYSETMGAWPIPSGMLDACMTAGTKQCFWRRSMLLGEERVLLASASM